MSLFNFGNKAGAAASPDPVSDSPAQAVADPVGQPADDQTLPVSGTENTGVKLTVDTEDVPAPQEPEPKAAPSDFTPQEPEPEPAPAADMFAGQPPVTEPPAEQPEPAATQDEDPIEKYNREQAETAMAAVGITDPAAQAAEEAVTDTTDFTPTDSITYDTQPEETPEEEATVEPDDPSEDPATTAQPTDDDPAGGEFSDLTAKMLEEINDLVGRRKEIEDRFEEDRKDLKEKRDTDVKVIDDHIDAIKTRMNSALNNIRKAVEALPASKGAHEEHRKHEK